MSKTQPTRFIRGDDSFLWHDQIMQCYVCESSNLYDVRIPAGIGWARLMLIQSRWSVHIIAAREKYGWLLPIYGGFSRFNPRIWQMEKAFTWSSSRQQRIARRIAILKKRKILISVSCKMGNVLSRISLSVRLTYSHTRRRRCQQRSGHASTLRQISSRRHPRVFWAYALARYSTCLDCLYS